MFYRQRRTADRQDSADFLASFHRVRMMALQFEEPFIARIARMNG